jgi:hypothetical protein
VSGRGLFDGPQNVVALLLSEAGPVGETQLVSQHDRNITYP